MGRNAILNLLRILPSLNAEKFLVVESDDRYHKATALELDNEKNLLVRSVSVRSSPEISLSSFLRSLRLSRTRAVVFSLDPKRIMTILAPVSIVRENAKSEVGEAELQNLVSQAVWLSLNRYRPQAAERLAAGNMGVLLANLRLLGVKADGREVIDPLGIHAAQLEFSLELSFVARGLMQEIKSVLPRDCSLSLFIESGVSFTRLVSRTISDSAFTFAHITSHVTDLYQFSREPRYVGSVGLPHIEHAGTLPWGGGNLEAAFADAFNVGGESARQLMYRYVESDVSPMVHRASQKIFSDAVADFFSGARTYLKKKTPWYWSSHELPLPDHLWEGEHIFLKHVAISSLLLRFGFKVRASAHLSTTWMSAIPPFLDYYYAKEGHWLNRLANTRAKWFIS